MRKCPLPALENWPDEDEFERFEAASPSPTVPEKQDDTTPADPEDERLTVGPEGGKLQTGSCTVTVPPGAVTENITCQVTSPNDITLPLKDGDMLVSDIIELSPHGTTFDKPVTVEMQYSSTSTDGAREPVMWVTEDKFQWKELITTAKSKEKLMASVNQCSTFAIVAQLKKDRFPVSSKETMLTSSAHPAVQIGFPEKSVLTPIQVNIQVQEVPKETVEAIKSHSYGLISTSPIVIVKTDSVVKFNELVTVRVPHPQHYMGIRHKGSSKLRVMSRDEGTEDWRDVTSEVQIQAIGDIVEFTVNHFSRYVVLEIETSNGDPEELGQIPQEMCNFIHQCDVKFIVLQQEDNTNAIFVECHKACNADREYTKYTRRGYKGPEPSETVRLREGQRVEVSLVGNVSFASFYRVDKRVIFHSERPPRLNIIARADQVQGEEGLEGIGSVMFFALPIIVVKTDDETRARDLINCQSPGKQERQASRLLCQIPIKIPYQRQLILGRGRSRPEICEYFYDIKEGVSKNWMDLAFHLGFKGADITNIAGRNYDAKASCMDLLNEWQRREGNAATIQVLKEALLKAGMRNVVDELNDKLKEEGTESRTGEDVVREASTHDTGQQDDAIPDDEQAGIGYMEGEGVLEHAEVSGRICQQEETKTLKDTDKLLLAKIEDVERKMENKIDQLNTNIGDRLAQLNQQFHDMVMKLERDSLEQQRLAIAISTVKRELLFQDFEALAITLGFNGHEIKAICNTAPADLQKQKSELLRLWRDREVNATVTHLQQACRRAGLSTLADQISGISRAPSRG
ncbi:p53-induced death domain-containing protein 1-like [Branchiostoma floridae]|uniref:P53-induced death domain-containing protein 1-like n=1 Tax=Branchiostoma floridae TaxID=7739 RepID=A0A9J7LC23_BRAFL|nr:p53-induced death domain-containing protein 1-like [Branchiostoma floridae]